MGVTCDVRIQYDHDCSTIAFAIVPKLSNLLVRLCSTRELYEACAQGSFMYVSHPFEVLSGTTEFR